MSMTNFQQYINGNWCNASNNATFTSDNPYTAEPWATIPRATPDDVEQAVAAAHQAFQRGVWSRTTATERGHLLRKLGDLIQKNAAALAEIEVRDNGKLYAEMSMQLNYIPQWFYYFAGLADKVEGAVLPTDKPDMFNFTRYEPLGVIACIIPWNSPLLITAWKIAPALAAGNTVVIKPSEYSSASALALMKLVEQAGFPPGVINVITGFGHEIGDLLVQHPFVAKISFTGGDATGEHLYQRAAAKLKPVCLELGGKSANIVFPDANIDNAVNGAIAGIFAATGQTCIAGSRLLLHESIHDQFLQKLLQIAGSAKIGNPMLADTQVGPVTNEPQYKKILEYMQVGKDEGATCVLGGDRAEIGTGWFVQPTVFTGVNPQMRIAQEEIFGPILSVIPFHDDEEAISIANDSLYGLAAGVWSNDLARTHQLAARLQAGTVWVNTYRMLSYMTPFGGYKRSGIGRESGAQAIYEFLQCKSVWMSTGKTFANPFVMR